MLYRYPVEQKRTAQEIVVGNKRYDAYTGEELPPMPIVATQPVKTNTAAGSSGTTAAKTTSAAEKKSAQVTQAPAVSYQELLAVQKAQREAELQAQKKAQLEKQYDSGKKMLKENYNSQQNDMKLSNDDIMRQLYIAYMQGVKNMSQQQAMYGAGGEIESIKNRHRINYENNRAKQNNAYQSAVSEIQQKYNKDLMELEEKYIKQLMNL